MNGFIAHARIRICQSELCDRKIGSELRPRPTGSKPKQRAQRLLTAQHGSRPLRGERPPRALQAAKHVGGLPVRQPRPAFDPGLEEAGSGRGGLGRGCGHVCVPGAGGGAAGREGGDRTGSWSWTGWHRRSSDGCQSNYNGQKTRLGLPLRQRRGEPARSLPGIGAGVGAELGRGLGALPGRGLRPGAGGRHRLLEGHLCAAAADTGAPVLGHGRHPAGVQDPLRAGHRLPRHAEGTFHGEGGPLRPTERHPHLQSSENTTQE